MLKNLIMNNDNKICCLRLKLLTDPKSKILTGALQRKSSHRDKCRFGTEIPASCNVHPAAATIYHFYFDIVEESALNVILIKSMLLLHLTKNKYRLGIKFPARCNVHPVAVTIYLFYFDIVEKGVPDVNFNQNKTGVFLLSKDNSKVCFMQQISNLQHKTTCLNFSRLRGKRTPKSPFNTKPLSIFI